MTADADVVVVGAGLAGLTAAARAAARAARKPVGRLPERTLGHGGARLEVP